MKVKFREFDDAITYNANFQTNECLHFLESKQAETLSSL